ncbi:MAG: diguanylate cyclase, partial [Alphaproteobacteria bacterium]|nr:diguanylate cyclase [Alphaproteobacteria bacterium]
DEFCALLSTRKKSETVINELREALQKPMQIDGCDDKLIIDASIGVAAYPSDGGSLEELISHADRSMYGVKVKV